MNWSTLSRFSPSSLFAAVSASVLALVGGATPATAATSGNWVLNGATVDYGGANTLRIGYGTVEINGVATEAPSTGAAVNATLAPAANIAWAIAAGGGCGGALAASTAYYVYFESQDNGRDGLIVTAVSPLENGLPSAALAYNPGTGCNGPAGKPAIDFVYLGSFVTDTTGSVIPFTRAGETLLFGAEMGASVTLTPAAPIDLTVNLANIFNWPTVAPEYLLSWFFINNDTGPHLVEIGDANFGTLNCTGGAVVISELYSLATPNRTGRHEFAYPSNFTTGSATDLSVGTCDTISAGKSLAVSILYRGYVDPIHHLNQPR